MWWLVTATAWSASVDRGLQARVFPPAFDFAAQEVVTTPITLAPRDISTEVECYHDVEITNFNMILSVDAMDVTLEEGQLAVDIDFGTVIGYNIGVFADSDFFDICLDFDTTLEYLELEDGHLTGTLTPVDGPEGVSLQFVEDPVLDGKIDSDAKNFPDDLVWALFNGLMKNQIEKALAEQIPTLLTEPIDGVFASPFGDLALQVLVADVVPEPEGLYAAADVDVGGGGDDRAPHILMDPKGQSHFAVALTDGVLQDLISVTWGSGVFDDNSPINNLLLDQVASILGLPPDVTMVLEVTGNPAVEVGTDVVTMSLPGTTMEAFSEGERLLHLVVNLEAELEPNVEPALGSILLSAHEVKIDVVEIDASPLVASGEEGEQHLADFLETWVAQAVTDAIDHTPVFGSQFAAWGYVLLLDDVALLDKSVVTWFTVYRTDDPAVDLVPPETAVDVSVVVDQVTLALGGEDDRGGELSWKWRVDGGAWSHWGRKADVSVVGLTPGEHVVEAVSRDSWQNEDPTAASVAFEVQAPAASPPVTTCGCSGSPAPALSPLLLVALLRRRQRGR